MANPLHILCISRFFKGNDFIRSAATQGHKVYLLTSKKLENDSWCWESITDVYFMLEDEEGQWNKKHLVEGLAHTLRYLSFDIFVALDDFDVEHVAFLREYFRIPGMGETTARYFRDKLAMRMQAAAHGIPVPQFSSLFHDADIHAFIETVPAPWLVKPRMQASAAGIKKIEDAASLWSHLDYLGSERHEYLIEQYRPGQVYHVDALSFDGNVVFSQASQYIDPPFDVAHGGGIFRSSSMSNEEEDASMLALLNKQVLQAFGMKYSACHTEFIKSHQDGNFYFLETASRVGGANIAEMVEFATGINLWKEWALLEIAACTKRPYTPPPAKQLHAGILISLTSSKEVDDSVFTDPEIVWRLKKDHHIGMIVQSHSKERVRSLLDQYAGQIRASFHASMPSKEKLID